MPCHETILCAHRARFDYVMQIVCALFSFLAVRNKTDSFFGVHNNCKECISLSETDTSSENAAIKHKICDSLLESCRRYRNFFAGSAAAERLCWDERARKRV